MPKVMRAMEEYTGRITPVPVWSLYLIKNFESIEKVERRASRLVLKYRNAEI